MASGFRNAAQRLSQVPRPKIPEKLKGGRLEKIAVYFRNILEDYRMVAIETWQDMKEAPVKSSIYVSLLVSGIYLAKKTPSEDAFREQMVQNNNLLLQIGSPIRSPVADKHMMQLAKWDNAGLLRYWNLGVFSIMWVDNYEKQLSIFEARAKPLQVGWLEVRERVVDVGFHGHWLWLERIMDEYDINPLEWDEPVKETVQLPQV